MKRQRWWNTPNYYVMYATWVVAGLGAGVFSVGGVHVGVLYLFLGGPKMTPMEMFLYCLTTAGLFILCIFMHRYDRIINPKFLRRINQKKG